MKKFIWISCSLLLGLTVCLIGVLALEGEKGPLHRAVHRSFLGYPPARAVEAADKQDWQAAFNEALLCTNRTLKPGLAKQKLLQDSHEPLPIVGAAEREEQLAIMRRSDVNDLAHCSLLLGQAATKLGRHAEASRAFELTRSLTYARVYDSDRKEFWSPARRASESLRGSN